MEGGGGDNFHDWEVVQSSDSASESDSALFDDSRGVEIDATDGDYSGGMIRLDYFSLDNENRYVKSGVVEEEEGEIESDNPSWIDPGSESRYPVKNVSGEFWSDSGSDRSDERKISDLFRTDDHLMSEVMKQEEVVEEVSEVVCDDGVVNKEEMEVEVEEERRVVASGGGGGGDESKGRIVWWKVPFEVLKYCVLKVNPVWSFSMAAAVMGLVILGRKLYRMKRKTKSLQLKVTLDDKVCVCFWLCVLIDVVVVRLCVGWIVNCVCLCWNWMS